MQLKLFLVLLTPLMVISCSQGPMLDDETGGAVIEAQFIDDPVKGLEVAMTSGQSAKTGSQGKFNCVAGEKVEFKLKGLELGAALCGEKIFVDDLESDAPGFSPEKVAAVIQSLAPKNGEEFDLDAVEIPDDHLADIDFSTLDDTVLTNKQDGMNYQELTPPVVLNPADTSVIRNLLDQAIAAYSNLSSALSSVLSALAVGKDDTYDTISSAGKLITVRGSLVSNDEEGNCFQYFQAKVAITQEGANKPFKLSVKRAAYFDALDVFDPLTNRCTNDGWCDDDNNGLVELPAPKLLATPTIGFLATTTETGFVSVSSSSLTVSVSEGLSISGAVVNAVEETDDQGEEQAYACAYTLTTDEVDYPETGPYTEDDGSDDPVHDGDGTFSGTISCTGSVSSVSVVLVVNGYQGTVSFNGAAAQNIDFTNDTQTPDDTPFLAYSFDDGRSIMGYHNWGDNGPVSYRFTYSGSTFTCANGTLPKQ